MNQARRPQLQGIADQLSELRAEIETLLAEEKAAFGDRRPVIDDLPGRAFSVDHLAERWECSTQHIRDLVNAGNLPAFRVGRLIRNSAETVTAFEQGNDLPSPVEEDSAGDIPTASPPARKTIRVPSGRYMRLTR